MVVDSTDELLVRATGEWVQAIADALPAAEECPEAPFSPSFRRKIQKLIRKSENKERAKYVALKRVACFFLAFIASAGLFLGVNTEARAALFGWVEDRAEEFYHYFFVGGASDKSSAGAQMSYELGWVPDGYTLLDSVENDLGRTLFYVSEDGAIIQFVYRYGEDANSVFLFDGEYDGTRIIAGGQEASVYLATNPDDPSAIVWIDVDDGIMFSIYANVDEDELIKMAEGVTSV